MIDIAAKLALIIRVSAHFAHTQNFPSNVVWENKKSHRQSRLMINKWWLLQFSHWFSLNLSSIFYRTQPLLRALLFVVAKLIGWMEGQTLIGNQHRPWTVCINPTSTVTNWEKQNKSENAHWSREQISCLKWFAKGCDTSTNVIPLISHGLLPPLEKKKRIEWFLFIKELHDIAPTVWER